ncbi:MAG: hypothetical protein OEY52_14275 [Gammaproteobacteria bacterium]|nr:hypothetical protein [Gammaproteobacteria bacterium]
MTCLCVSRKFYIALVTIIALNFVAAGAKASEMLKPFVLAESSAKGTLVALEATVKNKLVKNGFDVVGQYSPYKDTRILVVSSQQLREHAAMSDYGAYGAILRVTLSKTDKGTQISYTHPVYMSHVYRMKTNLLDVYNKLSKVLGNEKIYGSEEGLSKDDLRNYQYKWLMPYFSDRHELADYGSQEVALAKVEKVLASGAGGTSKVYRVDLPGKQESVIGVGLSGPADNDCSGDQYIMSRIDFKPIKSAGHLPWEVVVSKGRVYALYAEFRIAINFPDLSMMGSNSFASIMCAPPAIKTALTKGVGGKEGEE